MELTIADARRSPISWTRIFSVMPSPLALPYRPCLLSRTSLLATVADSFVIDEIFDPCRFDRVAHRVGLTVILTLVFLVVIVKQYKIKIVRCRWAVP